MAYIYQVAFELPSSQLSELEIGASLERVIGYIRATLPGEAGFVTSRAMRSVETDRKVFVVLETTWETWDDLLAHRQTGLSEDKVLLEFGPHITKEHLDVRTYEEVS